MKGIELVKIYRQADSSWLTGQITWSATDGASMKLVVSDGSTYIEQADDLFECLVEIRRETDPLGLRICCAGCKKDAYPSRMNREMGGGSKVQIRTLGRPTQREDQIGIFEAVNLSEVGTVEEQEAYYRIWLASLR